MKYIYLSDFSPFTYGYLTFRCVYRIKLALRRCFPLSRMTTNYLISPEILLQ